MIEFLLKFNKRLYFSAENIGNTIIKGLEFTSGLGFEKGDYKFEITGGYLYIDPKYKNFEDEMVKQTVSNDSVNILKYRYKHTFRFDADLNYKNFNFGIGSSYSSFMISVDRILEQEILVKDVKEYRVRNNKGTHVLRGRIGYTLGKINFSLNIDNLFNKEYSVRPGLLEAPRSFTMNVIYSIR
jgi:iron complex outermembrane receptor protein